MDSTVLVPAGGLEDRLTLRRLAVDLSLLMAGLGLVVLIADLGSQMAVSFHPSARQAGLDLAPIHLPYYAARSLLRMFIGLTISLLIGVGVGSLTARSAVAERLVLPVVDVLQSVPVLGFLAVIVPFFLGLFPGSLLGLEAASIFAIITGQVWNLIFCYHQSLATIPKELEEAAGVYGFSGWQRFTRLELPASAIPLVWNGMVSFAGGWFFATQSEAISVNNASYTLPGLGSYVASAIARQRMDCVLWALLTMLVLIVLTDQLFWRPIVAWSERFRLDSGAAAQPAGSWLLDVFQQSRGLAWLGGRLDRMGAPLRRRLNRWTAAGPHGQLRVRRRQAPRWLDALVLLLGGLLLALTLQHSLERVGHPEILRVVGLGLLTLGRVAAVVGASTLVFLPLAVTIGLRPRLASVLQPLILMLASIPANLLFPFFTVVFLVTGTPLAVGCVLLMGMGAQWYVLFNATAGASAIPNDLREMAQVFQLRGRQRWRRFLMPALFSSWVTGAVTASGAAWNASIVAELVTWGHQRLATPGLGSYIAEATASGDKPRLLLGLVVMSLLVVGFNRVLWRPLYRLAERRYGD
jgi:NitT/TauT family transport system permease protein